MKSEKNTLKNQKHKILVVDDEKMIRWSLGEALRGWGYEPIEVGTAAAGLSAFEAETPRRSCSTLICPTVRALTCCARFVIDSRTRW